MAIHNLCMLNGFAGVMASLCNLEGGRAPDNPQVNVARGGGGEGVLDPHLNTRVLAQHLPEVCTLYS